MQPAKKIVTWACAVFKGLLSGLYLRLVCLYCSSLKKLSSLCDVKCYIFPNSIELIKPFSF